MRLLAWLRRLFAPRPAHVPQVLHFKSPDDALAYACKYIECSHREGVMLPCVLDDVERSADGQAIGVIRLAAQGAPLKTIGAFNGKEQYPEACIASLCAAFIGPAVAGIPTVLLVAQLEPSLDVARGWKIQRRL
jgi:hypothetical protein